MKAQKQIVDRLTNKYEDGILNNIYYFQSFYIAFCIACIELEKRGIIEINLEEIKDRNDKFRYIESKLVDKAFELANGDSTKINDIYASISDKYIRELQEAVRLDKGVIFEFGRVFEQIQIDTNEMGDLETDDSIGIAEFEFSE